MTRTTHFFIATALACLAASVFLIKQVKLGIPMSFTTSVMAAIVISVVVPLCATALFAYVRKGKPGGRFIVFELTCLFTAVAIGIATF